MVGSSSYTPPKTTTSKHELDLIVLTIAAAYNRMDTISLKKKDTFL